MCQRSYHPIETFLNNAVLYGGPLLALSFFMTRILASFVLKLTSVLGASGIAVIALALTAILAEVARSRALGNCLKA